MLVEEKEIPDLFKYGAKKPITGKREPRYYDERGQIC